MSAPEYAHPEIMIPDNVTDEELKKIIKSTEPIAIPSASLLVRPLTTALGLAGAALSSIINR